MPSNSLFWISLGFVAIGYVGTLFYLYSRERDDGTEFHSGRVPGYSYTEGRNIGLDASLVPLDGGDWLPLRLETFHESERTRLIFSLAFETDVDDAGRIREFFAALSAEIQTRSDADVVYLQAESEHELGGRWHYVYAPDGRGWWGREEIRTVFKSPLESAVVTL